MAIEFIPTTLNGHAQRFQPTTSMTAKNPASIPNVQPELNSAHEGVQMRLTLGQTVRSASAPSARHSAPAPASHTNFATLLFGPRSNSPAIRPRIIVAIEGTKLSVAYPPSL